MKNLIYLVLLSVTLISCSEEKVAKRINWTSESQQAIQLFEEFLKINEFEKDTARISRKTDGFNFKFRFKILSWLKLFIHLVQMRKTDKVLCQHMKI